MITFIKNFIVHVVIPILLMILIVVSTLWLWHGREILLDSQTKNLNQGIGIGDRYALNIDAWQPYYGGGIGSDKIISLHGESLRISTGGDGGWYGARANIGPIDMSKVSGITVSVYAAEWKELDRVLLIFSNSSLSDYYGLDLKNYFAEPISNEWIEITIPRSAFMVIEGEPDWKSIANVAIRVIPKAGVATRVWFDEFYLIPEKTTEGIVTFTFDDGFSSTMNAFDVLNIYDYRGTTFIIPEWLGRENYMETADINTLSQAGWDISGHGMNNLRDLAPSDVDTHLATTYAYLEAGNYQGRYHYAYPNGSYNESIKSQVSEYFSSARTIDGFMQPTEYIIPTTVNAVTVSSSTPVSEVIALIDDAKTNNSWLNLVWHDFKAQPVSDVEYRLEDFAQVVEYAASQQMTVLPYSEAYELLVSQTGN